MPHVNSHENCIVTLSGLTVATLFAFLFWHYVPENSGNISLVYILALITIVRFTDGYLPGPISSVIAVVCVNFLFTYPYFELNFTLSGYPVTFLGMLGGGNAAYEHNDREYQRTGLYDRRERQTALGNREGGDASWLLNMVENLPAVTRIHDQSSTVKKTDESVEEIISAAILRLKKRLPEAAVTVAVPDELLIIPMDAILIEQVLINLLENAIIHSQSTEPVLCYVDDDATTVTFHVKDYGIGIDPERITNIFDGNSYIGNKESDSNKGMGIGLSICKTILTAHGGTINAQNHAQGAEFYFSLPKELK